MFNNDKNIVGYGASGQPATIIQYCGINHQHLEYMVDDAPSKVGILHSRLSSFIKPSEEIYEDLPDYILIFAWGYFPEISDKHRRYFDKGGKAILPLPDVRVNYNLY